MSGNNDEMERFRKLMERGQLIEFHKKCRTIQQTHFNLKYSNCILI